MAVTPLVFGRSHADVKLDPAMANRHGLITGSTGTGKTVTLRVLVELFSSIGVPVFLPDIKGDLSGLTRPGGDSTKVIERIQKMNLGQFPFEGYPAVFWDIFGISGHPVRTTISDMGPLLLSRILGLNDTQSGVLTMIFKYADEKGLLLLDLKDLRAILAYSSEHADEFKAAYGNITPATTGAIQRGLLTLEEQGADRFFGEPALDVAEIRKVRDGKGIINLLAADRLFQSPTLYSTFLLWLLSEIYEGLPESGDLEKPKLVFFFDEAHLLFKDAPKPLEDKIVQIVRLIRSKGVGVFFITQSPSDLPDEVLGQLGNKIEHALRATTPKEMKAVRTVALSLRPNPEFNTEKIITELAIGEALVSLLDSEGIPTIVERTVIYPPHSRLLPLSPDERAEEMKKSELSGKYNTTIDRESAYERLSARAAAENPVKEPEKTKPTKKTAPQSTGTTTHTKKSQASSSGEEIISVIAKTAASPIGRQIGKEIMRGVLGSLTKGMK